MVHRSLSGHPSVDATGIGAHKERGDRSSAGVGGVCAAMEHEEPPHCRQLHIYLKLNDYLLSTLTVHYLDFGFEIQYNALHNRSVLRADVHTITKRRLETNGARQFGLPFVHSTALASHLI
jgi:hypothetical protein